MQRSKRTMLGQLYELHWREAILIRKNVKKDGEGEKKEYKWHVC